MYFYIGGKPKSIEFFVCLPDFFLKKEGSPFCCYLSLFPNNRHEQRAFISNAVAALPPNSKLAIEIAREIAEIDAVLGGAGGGGTRFPDGALLVPHKVGAAVQCGKYGITFGSDGSIVGLKTTALEGDAFSWADASHPIARLWWVVLRYPRNHVPQHV